MIARKPQYPPLPVSYTPASTSACSKITCLECHGPKPDAPCKNCNRQVRPAFEDILPSSLKAVSMEPAFATKSSAFAVLTPLKCGQCQTGYQLGLTHYALTAEWRLLNDPSLIRSDSLPRDVTQRANDEAPEAFSRKGSGLAFLAGR